MTFVGSADALTDCSKRSVCTASKGAIVALTRALGADHLALGVRFKAVSPGRDRDRWVSACSTHRPMKPSSVRNGIDASRAGVWGVSR